MGWRLRAKYELQEKDNVLQFAALSFDVAAEELFPTWLSGATVVLRPERILTSFADFHQFIEALNISVLNLPAAYWQAWVSELERTATAVPATVRLVVTGSEKVATDTLVRWQQLAPADVRWLNAYGPTEATITSTIYEPDGAVETVSTAVPIGTPIDNLQAYLLDKQMQPVPVGVAGELYLGGMGLARGYLNRPDLTNEKFIPNPFVTDAEARLYKTGDLGRYLADGNIEFLGRADHQVKIRGFRIELGEIEAALLAQDGIAAGVVAVWTDGDGNGRLVAYIITTTPIDETDLQTNLKTQLPEYMVPAYIVTLDALPMTPSGKIDRQALPPPGITQESNKPTVALAETETEMNLVRIWEEILNVQPIGIEDNYFDLGGHSLLAMRMVAHIREALGVAVTVADIFTTLTIAQLAQKIDAERDVPFIDLAGQLTDIERDDSVVHLSSDSHGYPLAPAQLGLWFIDRLDPGKPFYNISMAVRLKGSLDVAILQESLETMVQRHEALRTVFASNDGNPVQIVRPVVVPIVVHDLSALAAEAAEAEMLQLLEADAKRPFALEVGPLFRVHLMKLHDVEHVLYVNMHHIISDGWSMDLFLQELSTIYQALSAGEAVPLSPLPVQYIEFAQWHNELIVSTEVQAQLDYWQEKLRGAAPVLELPTDHPRPAVQKNEGDIIFFEFNPALTQPLRALSKQAGASMFMTLLAAYKVLLARYAGQTDILVGTPTASRHTTELEKLIGYFINMVVLRSDLSGNPTFQALLAQVRQTAFEAYANDDIPFDRLVGLLHSGRDLSYNALYQVDFSYQSLDEALAFADLDTRLVHHHNGTSKIDLSVELWEEDGRLQGLFEYDTALFERTTIERMIAQFEVLLTAVIADPTTPIENLQILPDAERHMVVAGWNDTAVALPKRPLLHHLFEQQVAATPNGLALVAGEQKLTYAELNGRANQLAHFLKSCGLKTEQFVGLYMERSVDMLVGMLATMKAGGAYVPLDPSYPEERLRTMLTDATGQDFIDPHSTARCYLACCGTYGSFGL